MSTPTRIREIRASFVWFERWGDIWSEAKPAVKDFLRSAEGYAKELDQMIAETVKRVAAGQEIPASRLEATALTPPWPFRKPEYCHLFWKFYLGKDPAQIDGALALRKLAPFRTGFPATIRARKKWIAVMTDGFIYPHGMGLVLALRLTFDRGEWPKGGVQTGIAVRSALLACSDELYEATWNGAQRAPARLSELVDALFENLRARTLGPGAAVGERTKLPFTVAAVIRGDTSLIASAPQETGDIHRMLQALCNLSKSWENDTLDSYKSALLRLRRSAPKEHLLYHTARGRAVWFPALFAATGSFIRSCGCYHRNLVLLHQQTEALLQALAARRDLLSKGAKVPGPLQQMAKDAAEQVSTIYSSSDNSYQSSSARAYLDDTPSQKKLVNDALADDKKDPLKYEPWPA
jgi:hypothetical protein